MSITITITDITNLTDMERAVLRLIAADPCVCVGDGSGEALPEAPMSTYAAEGFAIPIEPEEVYSPHATVIDTPPAQGVAPAPTTPPVAVVPTPPGSAELDAAGLPWDKRIHASTRTKVAAGTWKYARGVADDYVAQIERELRAVQAIPAPVVSNIAPEVFAAVAPTPIVPLPPVPTAPTAALPMTFAQLMQHITPMLVSGKLNQSMLQGVVDTLGLPHLAALGARPDLVETVRAAIDAAVGGV